VLAIDVQVHPFSAVIDMEHGTLLASDTTGELEGWQIMDAVELANSD
jgi:hypothetical protein